MKTPSPALLIALLSSTSVLAQTTALSFEDLSRGITLGPTSAALVDEATASNVNPAGLANVGGAELIYLHERSVARNQVGDGFYLADTFFHALSLGVSTEWMRSTTLADVRKTTWSLAMGGSAFSFGLGLNLYNSWEERTLSGLASLSLGVQSRPLRWLALGASLQNVDEPTRGVVRLPRRFDFGVGFRPFKERLTLAVDYLVRTDAGFGNGAVQGTVKAEIISGLTVGVGVSQGLGPRDDLRVQLGLTLNTEHFGAQYTFGYSPGGADHVFGVRLSQASYGSAVALEGKVALFDLDDLLAQTGGALSLLGGTTADPYLEVTELLDRAARDPMLRGVILKISNLPGTGLGKADELRHAILRLRAANKKVLAVLLNGGDTEYFVASAADRVYAVPQALLLINGFEAQMTFLGDTMEKLGVKWDVARVGAYKNAPDQLTRSAASPEQRETVNAYLDTDVRTVEAAITAARHIPVERLHEAQALGLVPGRKALALGLIDGILDTEALEKAVGEQIPGSHFDATYAPPGYDQRWGSRRRIALIPVVGDIAGGKSREAPFGLARIAGAETVVLALKRAEEDPSVAAIVLRVDSGGGDGLASDLMYRAVLSAKKKKPVIASMGDVAASGGYYAAMGADAVFASPTTITGSIGVFVVKPGVEQLAERLGVHQESVKRGPLAGILDLYHPWTPEEQKAAQAWVDAFYDDFITEVASSRHLAKSRVDALARGRVWSGADAKDRGLVDQLGGLHDALEEARRRAKLNASEEVEITVFGEPHGLLAALGGEPGAAAVAKALGIVPAAGLPENLAALVREAGFPSLALAEPGLKAMMPFTLGVR